METDLDIIRRQCGDLESRLRACHNRAIAEALKERLCSELNTRCKSEMIQTVLSQRVEALMDRIFDQKGRNIYLENEGDEE